MTIFSQQWKYPRLASVALACAAALQMGSAWAAGARAAVLRVPPGETVEVSRTTELSELSLGEGASLTAPDGYSLTLTVDGIGLPIEARRYQGHVVLTLTEAIGVTFSLGDTSYDYDFRTGLYFEDGAVDVDRSVLAIVAKGVISGSDVSDLQLTSRDAKFNGVMWTGTGTHRLIRPRMDLLGNGGNDFVGFGAGLWAGDSTTVNVEGGTIVTKGVIRPAVFAQDSAVLTVRGTRITAYTGTDMPDDYVQGTIQPGKMYEVPWVLGLSGTNRATLATGSAQVTYENARITAQAWGALSTDSVVSVALNAKNSLVETVDSGYGAYADGSSVDTFSATTFKVADMAAIMSSGSASATFQKGCVVSSGRFGVMIHGNTSGTLTIADSQFTTEAAVVQAKSSTTTVAIRNSQLRPANGLLIQAVVNDDPNASNTGGSNVTASLTDSRLSGDIVNGNTSTGAVTVALANTQLQGAITTAATVHATDESGNSLSSTSYDLYWLIGEFVHTYGTTGQSVSVSLDGSSTWVVDKTSYLTSLTLASGAKLRAPAGRSLRLTVDGVATAITAGKSYSGTLVLTVV
jgi:hypothetical protein